MIGRAFIRAYQLTFSALVGHHCRHLPTCSHFGDEALARYGLWAGGWMTLARLSRCHPFGTSGIDNVPPEIAGGRALVPPMALRAMVVEIARRSILLLTSARPFVRPPQRVM